MQKTYWMIPLLMILLGCKNGNSQKRLATPASIIDSLLLSVKNNDFEMFGRQYFSNQDIQIKWGYPQRPPSEKLDKEIKELLRKHKRKITKDFEHLKEVVKKYNLTVDDLIKNTFKYESYFQQRLKKREYETSRMHFKFVKDTTFISFQLSPMYLRSSQWKIDPVWDLKIYTDEVDSKYRKSNYLVRVFPQDPLEYAQQIYQNIKNQDIKGLLKAYPTSAELKKILGNSERNYREAMEDIQKNKRNLVKNFDQFYITYIDSLIAEKTYLKWGKRTYLHTPDFGIRLYLQTGVGVKKLHLRCIIADERILLVDIEPRLRD